MAIQTLAVVEAGFTPLKGARHLSLPSVELDAEGPIGDRRFCLVDAATGRVLRTVQHPRLIGIIARLHGELLELTSPDGATVRTRPEPTGERLRAEYWGRKVDLALTAGRHDDLLSDWLDRPVRLAIAPRGGVVFADPLTIVTTSSIRDLADRAGLPEVTQEAGRFRATLVVDTDEPYAEVDWLGQTLRVGEATVRIGGQIPRCAVIDHSPVTGVKDARLLKTLVGYRPRNDAGEPAFGVYARVVEGGLITP